ncbi:MAG: nitrilase family protein [Bacteroidetes bacterium]|nr:nitrilase family protein [Bacteroidota bacterium]
MSSLTVSLIQFDIKWESVSENLLFLENKILQLPPTNEIVVLPEMFSTGFTMNSKSNAETMEGQTVSWMKNISAKSGNIITGSIIVTENGKYYNRLIWMQPNGIYYCYDKRHLFAFADENKNFNPGEKRVITSVKGWKINLLICYDLRFPVWCRQSFPNEYDILLFVANWPQQRVYAWETLLKARSIENQCFTIGVNRCGIDNNKIYYNGQSIISGTDGTVIKNAGERENIITYTFHKKQLTDFRQRFPFLKDADEFKIFN